MARKALVSVVRAALIAGVAFAISAGCSRQAEGERCDYYNAGDQDCDDGLVCTPCGDLQLGKAGGDLCCRPGGSYSDTRCIPTTNRTGEDCSHPGANSTAGRSGTSTAGTGSGATAGSGAIAGSGGVGGMSEMPNDTGGTSDVAGGAGAPAAGTGG